MGSEHCGMQSASAVWELQSSWFLANSQLERGNMILLTEQQQMPFKNTGRQKQKIISKYVLS
jgi:hypothetical protein